MTKIKSDDLRAYRSGSLSLLQLMLVLGVISLSVTWVLQYFL